MARWLVYFYPSGSGAWRGRVLLGPQSPQCPLMWTEIINDIDQSDARWRPGVLCVVVCVKVCGRKRKGDGEGGEDEKTWGASFNAVNVQIYVEGQWSTFIRSYFLPSPPPLPPQAFSFLPLPPHSLPPCHSPSFLLSLPGFSLSLIRLSWLPPFPPCVSHERTEIVVDCSDQTNRRHR